MNVNQHILIEVKKVKTSFCAIGIDNTFVELALYFLLC